MELQLWTDSIFSVGLLPLLEVPTVNDLILSDAHFETTEQEFSRRLHRGVA